jgi:hypothetical protein
MSGISAFIVLATCHWILGYHGKARIFGRTVSRSHLKPSFTVLLITMLLDGTARRCPEPYQQPILLGYYGGIISILCITILGLGTGPGKLIWVPLDFIVKFICIVTHWMWWLPTLRWVKFMRKLIPKRMDSYFFPGAFNSNVYYDEDEPWTWRDQVACWFRSVELLICLLWLVVVLPTIAWMNILEWMGTNIADVVVMHGEDESQSPLESDWEAIDTMDAEEKGERSSLMKE